MSTEKTKRNSLILAVIILAILLLCVCPIGVIGFMRAAAPAVSTAMEPTTVKDPGATVVIKTFTQTPGPTTTPTPGPLGKTRDKPYPMNTPVDIGGDMELTVLSVTRPANDIVAKGNIFNETPVPGSEFMIVQLGVKCNKSTNDRCNFISFQIKTVGMDGQVRDAASVAGIPNEIQTTEFFGGSLIAGGMPFQVTQGDTTVVLIFEPFIVGDPIYIALSK